MNVTNAAHALLGKTLSSGWHVIEKFTKDEDSTGSVFSVCYKVEKNGKIAFLKAFNFAAFFQITHSKSFIDVFSEMVNAFKYERDLSEMCKQNNTSKVVVVRDAGEETIQGYSNPVVPYLIFDLGEGDVRRKLKFSERLDYAWRLKSLHNISVGLKQLHNINVSHQDLKPSNVLTFSNNESKIGDLGRSVCPSLDAPHLRGFEVYSGDFNYAPPEIMYGYYELEWKKRAQATDCYLLGSLIVFYFSGLSMNALLTKHTPPNFHWTKWRGSFEDVKDYIIISFEKAIKDFSNNISHEIFRNDLTDLVRQLCYPIPANRGHFKTIQNSGNNYQLDRFITRLDYLKRKAEITLKY
jgi:serine/threonine protein kinase